MGLWIVAALIGATIFAAIAFLIASWFTLPELKAINDLSIAEGVPIIFAMMSAAPMGAFAGLAFTFWFFKAIGLRKYNGDSRVQG